MADIVAKYRPRTLKQQILDSLSFYLYETWNEGLGDVVLARYYVALGTFKKLHSTGKKKDSMKNEVPNNTMTANTRNFEAELQAQHEDAGQATAELHPEASVVPATAL